MKITIKSLHSKTQTGNEMHRLINRYSGDLRDIKVWRGGKLVPFTSLDLMGAFDLIRKIPYQRDIPPKEIVSRPRYIFQNRNNGADCKKKSILYASYLRERGIPYRLIASSRKKNRRVHHVFPQGNFLGQWRNCDATYSHYRLFEPKCVTRMEVLQ